MMRLLKPVAGLVVLMLLATAGALNAENSTGENGAPQQTAAPATADELLRDERPAGELSRQELAKRIKAARALIKAGGLSRDSIRQLRQMIRADREARRLGQQADESTAASSGGEDAAEPAGPKAPVIVAKIKNPVIELAGKPEIVFEYAKFRCKKLRAGARELNQATTHRTLR